LEVVPDGKPTGLDGQLLTPSDIGGVNRSRVIQAFCDYGPLTRADLAKMAGVTRATIGNIVAALIESGLIDEGEPRETGTVGKPGRPLWFGPRAGLTGAVSITPGLVDAALVNARGEELEKRVVAFDASDDERRVVGALGDALGKVLPRTTREVLGVGIAVPGVCNTTTGTVLGSGPVPVLTGVALGERIAERVHTRVLVDNDTRAQALGEKWFGQGRQKASFASVMTGHGIGVGLVLGGVVLRGPRGEAGEAGHITVQVDGEDCTCGMRGCWETIASLRWLRREAAALGIKHASKLDASHLVARAESDDAAAALLERYADNIAVGIAALQLILSPGLFILHGDAVGGGERLRALVQEAARRRVFAHVRRSVEILVSDLDQRATLLGAAGLVLSETFALTT
jgi:predicted NBD/HSP70 family sugar kinase